MVPARDFKLRTEQIRVALPPLASDVANSDRLWVTSQRARVISTTPPPQESIKTRIRLERETKKCFLERETE